MSETPASDSVGVFGDLKACEVLDTALSGQDYKPGRVSNAGSYNGCQATKRGIAVSLDMDDLQGIDDFDADPALTYAARIEGRPAVQIREGVADGGFCKVAFRVASKARAMVTTVLGADGPTEEACTQAVNVAVAVEPLLPER